jgi:hypothetical protein
VATEWNYQAEMINACNCDWGCPCNFNAKPTTGSCEGVWAAHITSGVCGETSLEGLKFAWGARWPGAVHEGRATARIWIDDSASEDQRDALEGILQGKFAGMPWMVIASTVDHWLETAYVPFAWTYDGTRSSYNAGNQVRVTLDDMHNPVSGLEASATIVLPTGLVTKEVHATATKMYSVFSQGLKIAAPGKYGFYCTAEHGT